MKPKFELGQEVMTRGVANWCMDDTALFDEVLNCLKRHVSGDWGELTREDEKANELALQRGERILSSYLVHGKRILVITEADRTATTILFPDEY